MCLIMWKYGIVGYFRWCMFSYIWPKSPQNKFSYVLILHAKAHASHLWPTAQHGDLTPGLWAILTSVSIVQLIKSLWVGRSKIWQNVSCLYLIFTVCSEEVKIHAKISDHSNFRSFFHMQNVHAKISTMRVSRYKVHVGTSATLLIFAGCGQESDTTYQGELGQEDPGLGIITISALTCL